MKKFLLPVASILFGALSISAEVVPAFPGAEGHGRYVQGGRGGKVIHVTTLQDYQYDKNKKETPIKGSLRWALSQSGPKTIVFDVSGYIDLKCNLKISSNTTIAGQTAPGNGITLRYATIEFNNCDNVIVRFIRFRRSQVKSSDDGADAAWGRNRHDIIIDHCSLSWSTDEVGSFYDNRNFTMQWCTLAEGLNFGHSKGDHSYGGIWGGKEASFHHNFMAHVQNRAPRFNGARYNWSGYDKTKYINTIDAERVDFRNCLIYNWGNGNGCYGGPGGGYINIVNNYYKAGPGTKNKTRVTQVSVSDSGNGGDNPFPGYASRYFINGNYVAAAGGKAVNYDWSGVIYDSGLSTINGEKYIVDEKHLYGEEKTYVKNINGKDCIRLKLDEPIDAGNVTTHDAQSAYEKVLNYAGASLYRDETDARYMEETHTGTVTYPDARPGGTKGILDVINDPDGEQDPKTASFPVLPSNVRAADFDTDGDGMPDEWERLNGLNPSDPSDAAAFTLDPKGWYSNLEVYLNSLVEHIMKGGNAGAISAVDEYYPSCKTSGIGSVIVDGEIERIEYYDLMGKRLAEPVKGINIRRIIYTDGRIEADKVLK